MSYNSINELPSEVRKAYTPEDAQIWMNEYNKAYEYHTRANQEHPATYARNVEFYSREDAWMACAFLPSSRYVQSNVSTEVVDNDGDVAIVKEYVDAGQSFVEDGGMVTRNHSNKAVGCTWKIMEGKDETTDKPCVIAFTNFFRGKTTYEIAWKEFCSHKLGWSIASMTRGERKCDANVCANFIHPTQWFELSLVNYPRNPVTYDVEYNESAKGIDVIEMHEDTCPILVKYEGFKEKLKSYNVETHIVESGVMLLKGAINDDASKLIAETYPDCYVYKGSVESGDYALIIPPIDDTDDFLEAMVELIDGERDAIAQYNTVKSALAMGRYLSNEDLVRATKAFDEVILDEESHIGVILGVIKLVSPKMYSSIAGGIKEAEESAKGCPAGQHEHPGVVGCHDIFRKHAIDYRTQPSDVIDLTDEDIDVNAIKETPTDKLREIVVRIAHTLAHLDRDAIDDFMSHTAGKEFVLAYLELKRRQHDNGSGMMTDEVAEKTPVEDVMKGYGADPQTILQNICSVLAQITATQDTINSRLMRMEAKIVSEEAKEHSSAGDSLASAILEGVGGMGADANEGEDKALKSAEAPPTEPKQEKTEEVKTNEVKTEIPAEGKTEEKTEEKTEVKKEVEKKDEDKKEESKAKGDAEAPVEDAKGVQTEPVAETQEAPIAEVKAEVIPEQTEIAEPTGSVDDTAKCDSPAPAKEQAKCGSPAPAVEQKSGAEAVPPIIEEAKCNDATTKAEPSMAEPTVAEPKKETVEPVRESKPDIPHPIAPGGDTVDFREAIRKRQDELKAKGIDYRVAEGSSTSSIAGGVGGVASNTVTLVQPSSVPVFGGTVSSNGSSFAEALKQMGSQDPKTFLKTLMGA